MQYFQIIEVEFYGDGPFVLVTIELVGDSPDEQPQYTVYVEPGYTIKNANGDDVSSDYIVVTTGSVDVNNAGEYTLTYTASFTDTSGPSISIDRTVNVIDAVNPEITINGDNPVNISHGLTYTDQGAFANDDVDGNITNSIQVSSNVNTSIVGTYTVTYSVADTAGNTTSATRTINVVDIIGPVIELQGDNPYSMYLNGTYSEPGYTATDNIDGEIDVNNVTTTDNIDASTVGTYTITYTATDSAGNEGTAIRTVNIVLDTVGPVITLEGENPYTLDLNGTYIEQGFTVDDNADGEIDVNNVTITNNIDVNTAGTYEVSYSVTDGAGNNTVVIRTVNVQILVAFNSSIAYIRRDDLATLINSFAEVSSLKEIYNMWYNNTQIAGGTDCWIYYAYSSIFNEVLYTTRKIEFFSKNDGTYEWIDNEIIVNATVTSNGLSVADLTDYTSFYSGLEPFNINMSSTSINTVNTLLNNSGYSLYNYIQIFNIWYNETNTFDMDYDNTTREVDVWVYVLTDQTAMEDILDKHATPIEPITDFDEKQITIEMLKPYLLEGGNVQPIFETRKLKYTVTNNNASYTWTLYTNETIESTINDTGYSIISSIDNYKLSYFYFDSYTVVRE